MKNEEIAAALYELSELLSLKHVRFKPQAYQRASRTIETLPTSVEKLYKKHGLEGLDEIPGVGEGIAKKIEELIKTGKIKRLKQLRKEAGKGIGGLLRIPGLGPKKIEKLRNELGVKDVKSLKRAAEKHQIRTLEGFGEKSEKYILESLGLTSVKDRVYLKEAEKEAKKIINYMKKISDVKKIEVAGSLRRKNPLIRDIDIIVASKNPKKVVERFTKMPKTKKVFSKGPTKASIVLESGIQSDLRVMAPDSYGAGLFYFTGNKNYNIEMRKIAIKKGMKLSEYGLFDKKTGGKIAGKSEKEICNKLGVKWRKPEDRNY